MRDGVWGMGLQIQKDTWNGNCPSLSANHKMVSKIKIWLNVEEAQRHQMSYSSNLSKLFTREVNSKSLYTHDDETFLANMQAERLSSVAQFN
jgi:hypothetical protein